MVQRRPIVGVMPLWDDEKNSIWMLPGYMDAVSLTGAVPIMFPFTADEGELEQLVELCTGILLTGGQDVSPLLYHESPMEDLVLPCPKRDEMETVVLRMALERDLPVLGICRGLQFLNVFLGGTLFQDLPRQHPSDTEHHQRPPYDRPIHNVDLVQDSPLRRLLGVGSLGVNSYHHQAVRRLAAPLEAMALSPDGLVEAAYMPEKRFVWAVQWHPEFSYKTDAHSMAVFRAFTDAMTQTSTAG